MIRAAIYVVTFYVDGRRVDRKTIRYGSVEQERAENRERGDRIGRGGGRWLAVYEDASEAQLPWFEGNDEELGQRIARTMGAKLPIRPDVRQQIVVRSTDT